MRRRLNGWALGELPAPGGDFGQRGEETEVVDHLEHVKVPKDRAEGGVHEAEMLPSEVRTGAKDTFQLLEAATNIARFRGQRAVA